MMAIRAAVGGLAIAVTCAGCGTVVNCALITPPTEVPASVVNPPPPAEPFFRVFGGVRYDVAALRALRWDQEFSFVNFAIAPVIGLDLPLSLVADTVTLPYTLGHAVNTAIRPAPPASDAAPAPR